MINTKLLASDNASGVHPDVLARLAEVNLGHVTGYGNDPYSEQAIARLRNHFGQDASVCFVFNGTAANVIAVRSAVRGFEAVICSEQAHLAVDECGAPEYAAGCKLLPLPAPDGRLQLADIARLVERDAGIVHRSQPRLVSLTQPTECGTLYQPEALSELVTGIHDLGLLVHIDGARLANAAAALEVSLADLTTHVGADLVSFGGTKNGLMMAEVLLGLTSQSQDLLAFIQKQSMQLASKQRFLAAQFLAYLDNDLWRNNAMQANEMAHYLARRLDDFQQVMQVHPVEVNMVFAKVPADWVAPIQQITPCLHWPGRQFSTVRLVTSFDTTPEDIDSFIERIAALAAQGATI